MQTGKQRKTRMESCWGPPAMKDLEGEKGLLSKTERRQRGAGEPCHWVKKWFHNDRMTHCVSWYTGGQLRPPRVEGEAEAQDPESMTGFSITEATGGLDRSWFSWRCVDQGLPGISWEGVGVAEMVTRSLDDPFENFSIKVYRQMRWLLVGVQSQGHMSICFNPIFQRQ